MATRADFNPSEIRSDSIRQRERWIAVANNPKPIQEFYLRCELDGYQRLILYVRNLAVIVEDLVGDPRFNGYQYLSFQLLERNGQRVFRPANSGVWWQINARAVGSDNVSVAQVVFEDASFAILRTSLSTVYLQSWLATWLPFSSFHGFKKAFSWQLQF